jgi:hypothetical protein
VPATCGTPASLAQAFPFQWRRNDAFDESETAIAHPSVAESMLTAVIAPGASKFVTRVHLAPFQWAMSMRDGPAIELPVWPTAHTLVGEIAAIPVISPATLNAVADVIAEPSAVCAAAEVLNVVPTVRHRIASGIASL